jgi:trans-2-enoyl-CoA reductase
MTEVRRLVFDRVGPPAEVLRLEEAELPDPGPGQVRVRMERASVNPADFNLIEGTYGVKPTLPAVPGNEGAGVVEAVGPGVEGWAAGDRVVVPGPGTWASRMNVEAARCTRVPPAVGAEFAAMLTVNPPTAWAMLHEFVRLEPGDWVVQNAATSAVGRCVIQIARALGWKTLNLVRRPEAVAELAVLGADAVEVEDAALPKRLRAITGGGPVRLGLNAVGGESAATVAKCLGPGGVLVTYGAMSRQPLKIPNGLLIFNDIRCHGFWMTRHYQTMGAEAKEAMFARLVELHLAGKLAVPVDAVFPLSGWAAALLRAGAEGRPGKVLLDLEG